MANKILYLCLCGLVLWSLFSTTASAQECAGWKRFSAECRTGEIALSSQVSVLSGDYGTGINTTITSLAETVKYTEDIGDISLTIPYLFRNGGGVTPGETVVATTNAIPNSANGIGDVVLKGKYYWLEETDVMPGVDVTLRIKFPTASRDQGLGTGRFDLGGGLSWMKRFGKLIGMLDTELVRRQRPRGSTLKSTRFDYSIGAGHPLTNKSTGYVFLDGSTKSSSSGGAPLELVLLGNYKPKKSFSANGYVLLGLTDESSDIGVGIGITQRF